MKFAERDAEARRVALSTIDYGADNVERARQELLKLLVAQTGGWADIKGATLSSDDEQILLATVLGHRVLGLFEVVKVGQALGGALYVPSDSAFTCWGDHVGASFLD